MSKKKDAWLQLHELYKKYTKNLWVREDLEVVAHGTDRSVELRIWEPGPRKQLKIRRIEGKTRRNVSTMRGLAQAILDACDFVEESNPEWASHLGPPVEIVED